MEVIVFGSRFSNDVRVIKYAFFYCVIHYSYLIHPRLEQPASSLLWLFPELGALWKLISLQKVHSWMRCFGHALPKPSVFVGNICMEIMQQLYRKWSKRMEERWKRAWHVLRSFWA